MSDFPRTLPFSAWVAASVVSCLACSSVDGMRPEGAGGVSAAGGAASSSGGRATGGEESLSSGGFSATGGSPSDASGGVASGGGESDGSGGEEPTGAGGGDDGVGGEVGSGGVVTTGGSGSGGSVGMSPELEVDVFGVTALYPTVAGGLEWDSRYWEGEAHELPAGGDSFDSLDPLALANRRGTGEVRVNGDGTLTMSGSEPRIYLATFGDHPWLNVEITVYYQRIEDDDTDWGGLVVGARGGPDGHGGDNCTATTYYARFRHDGAVDVEKELEHPASQVRASTALWDGDDPPYQQWIGMKYVVSNVNEGQNVRLQVYRDLQEGEMGGSWEPVVDYTDEGGWNPPQDCGFAEDHIITKGGGVVFIRNTGLVGEGALYKWLSVREIASF